MDDQDDSNTGTQLFPICVFNPKSLAKKWAIYKSAQYFQPRGSNQSFSTYTVIKLVWSVCPKMLGIAA